VIDAQQEFAAKQRITRVSGLLWEVQLRDELAPRARGAQLDVEVARAARVQSREDRLESVASAGVGELVPAQPEAVIVVGARGVGVPQVERPLGLVRRGAVARAARGGVEGCSARGQRERRRLGRRRISGRGGGPRD